jgi:hypothetical protein
LSKDHAFQVDGTRRISDCAGDELSPSTQNGAMTSRDRELLREALTSPIAQRADVAAELLASLDAAETDNPAESKLPGRPKSKDERGVRSLVVPRGSCGKTCGNARRQTPTIDQILRLPDAGGLVARTPADLPIKTTRRFSLPLSRHSPSHRGSYESLPSLTIAENRATGASA